MKQFVQNLLIENGMRCNADARTAIAAAVRHQFGTLPEPHELDLEKWSPIIKKAIEVGGCLPGTTYQYRNAQGETATVEVCDLYKIPKNLKNPVLVCFSGYMPAWEYAVEAERGYELTRDENAEELRIFVTGKGGNKGLYADVFNRKKGLMIKTEAEAYMRAMEHCMPSEKVREFERTVADTDTNGNFHEMYALAQAQGWDEVSFILCTGQPWYTKRLLAEGMLEFGKPEYKDVKVNLIVVDCPLTLDSNTPEGHLTEIMLGYIAASLGPLMKDTTPLRLYPEPDFSKERYLLPELESVDWSVFEELISMYSNMGWPNYQELLYGVDHETAVYNIIMADLRARSCFTPESYDHAIETDIRCYIGNVHPQLRQRRFSREINIKIGWYDGLRHHSHYGKASYLDFKSNRESYKGWEEDETTF